MILDYLRRVSNLRLFEPSAIQPQHRDPKIQWDPHYEKRWREERARRHAVSNDNCTNDQETPECYNTPPAMQPSEVIRIDVSESEDELVDEYETSITTYLLDCVDKASEPHPSCIYVQPAVYQKKSCDDAVADSESTLDAKHRFEMLLNILAHPNSEMHDNDSQLLPQAQIPKQSGKTAFLFEFLERVAVLNKDLDIAVVTNDQGTETVLYKALRSHNYECQRISNILEDNWSNERGVLFTTSDASYTKWSTRPNIDIIFIFDIRALNITERFSKMDGDKRILWIINKDTVEERAFTILQDSGSLQWGDIWNQSDALRNSLNQPNQWDTSLSFEESVQQSAKQAIELLFPKKKDKRPRSPRTDATIPSPKRRPLTIVLSDTEDSPENDDVPEKPTPLDVDQFQTRTNQVIETLLDFPETIDFGRKHKSVTKAAILSREFKETATTAEKKLYTVLQPRLEHIEARFQREYDETIDKLQREYKQMMMACQQRYRQEALSARDTLVIYRGSFPDLA